MNHYGPPKRLHAQVLTAKLVVAASLALCLVFPAMTFAAPYTVAQCQTAPVSSVSASGWLAKGVEPASGGFADNGCAQAADRHLSLWMSSSHDYAQGTEVGYQVTAPPDTAIIGYERSVRVRTSRAADGTWGFRHLGYATLEGSEQRVHLDTCDGCTETEHREVQFTARQNIRAGSIEEVLDCAKHYSYSANCPKGSGASLELSEMKLVLDDPKAPTWTNRPDGSLLDTDTPQSGLRTLEIAAGDQGSGLARLVVEVDGQQVIDQSLRDQAETCAEPYTILVPCAHSVQQAFTFDSTTISDGAHSVMVTAFDATGENRVTYGPVAITTSNGYGARCSERPQASVSLNLRRTRLRNGQRTRVTGRVLGLEGRPLEAAEVALLAGESEALPVASGRTASNGSYSMLLPAGPSRALRVGVRTPSDKLRFSCSQIRRTHVAASASLTINPRRIRNGKTVTLRGALRGGFVPANGKTLLVEARPTGAARWSTVRDLRSTAEGLFRFRYRFQRTLQTTKYDFRVRIPREHGYPFSAGHSRIKRVIVRR